MRDAVGHCDVPSSRGRFLLRPAVLLTVVGLCLLLAPGCAQGPRVLKSDEQKTIDRSLVEYPAGYELQPFIRNLTGATAIAFDAEGSIIIAEGGEGDEIRIYGFHLNDGTRFDIYPRSHRFPTPLGFLNRDATMYGPVGGLAVHEGKIYVSHRDPERLGRVTALTYKGEPSTIVAGLPARGDYGVTDIAINRGRLFFGVGSATNSGVVGLDNYAAGWLRRFPNLADVPYSNRKLWGLKFSTPNPTGGPFGGSDIAVTGPFQPFGVSNLIRIPRARDGKPNSAVYSIPIEGGRSGALLKVECFGVRMPRGLAFNEFGRLFMTNNGMEMRGSRPVKDDVDVLLRMVSGTDYLFPDYAADLNPISDARYQPPPELILPRGYPEVSFLVNHEESGLIRPDRETLLQASFPSQSGAAKMAFVPDSADSAFKQFGGSAIVALSGDRAPFATSGRKLVGYMGRKIMRVDLDTKVVQEFIRNVGNGPASSLKIKFEHGVDALERPVDVKFGPDGSLYILDMGQMQVKNGREKFKARTAQIFRLVPIASEAPATTDPVEQPAAAK